MFPRYLKAVLILVALLQISSLSPKVLAQDTGEPLDNVEDLLISVDDINASEPQTEVNGEEDTQQVIEAFEDLGIPADEPGTAPEGNGIQKDVILVLDNSGSMRQNDPEFLTSRAVTEFIRGLDEGTRLAIIIFDQNVSLAVPLTSVTLSNRNELLESLDKINYRGLFTDSPAAIERAIYELKNNARRDSQKLIIFMTDGIVDTGNTQVDLENSKWLRESLAPDAADSGIKIFGIAFTEDADFRLIQSLAQETGGEYYRALQAEDLARVFDEINNIIQQPPETVSVEPPQSQQPAVPVEQPPVIIELPQQPVQAMSEEERTRSIIIISAAAVMILAVLAILILLVRRGREIKAGTQEYVSEAYLNDIHGYTANASYKLGNKPTMLGRVAGMDTQHLDYIVIPESTIGRRHSLIEYKDYAYWIVDQGSINGTFVNDVPITSEVRLKHGDKIRLHKFEFEFVMPEMVDAGMTVVSQTVVAGASADVSEATEIKAAVTSEGSLGLDFDLTGDSYQQEAGSAEDLDSEDETLMPGASEPSNHFADEEDYSGAEESDSEDETLMPGSESATPPHGTPKFNPDETVEEELSADDETIMPGNFNLPEEDATIRKEVDENDKSLDDFLDIGSLDGEDDKQ